MSTSLVCTVRTAILITCVSLLMPACRDSERDEDVETLAAREAALAFHVFDDVLREVHRIAVQDPFLNEAGITQSFRSCIESHTLSNPNAGFPITLTIHYGINTAVCDDSITRHGNIMATFDGKYLDIGTKTTITFANYMHGKHECDGTVTLTTIGETSDGGWEFDWSVENATITSNTNRITWTATHERFWSKGTATFDKVSDDVFLTKGVSNGRTSRGNTFTNEITQAYESDFSCPWVITGRSLLTMPNVSDRSINYDTEACDRIFYQRRDNTYLEVEIP